MSKHEYKYPCPECKQPLYERMMGPIHVLQCETGCNWTEAGKIGESKEDFHERIDRWLRPRKPGGVVTNS